MIEVIDHDILVADRDPEVRNSELSRCFRHEGEDCPRCDSSGFRPRAKCASCGIPAKAVRRSPPSVARRAGRSLGPFRSTAWTVTPASPRLGWSFSKR